MAPVAGPAQGGASPPILAVNVGGVIVTGIEEGPDSQGTISSSIARGHDERGLAVIVESHGVGPPLEEEEDDGEEGKTKSGYKKDGFVVDYDEDDNDDEDADEDGDDDVEDAAKRTRKTTTKKSTIDYYNCDNELSEEPYFE
jgi:hypothetical protein